MATATETSAGQLATAGKITARFGSTKQWWDEFEIFIIDYIDKKIVLIIDQF